MNEPKLPIAAKHINCPHFSLCSGCTINEYVDSPPIADEVRRYFSQKQIDVKIIVDEVVGWRYRAKLAVRGSHVNPLVGLYREGSHEVVNIPFCKVHHPLINLGVEKLKKFITDQHVEPYNENSQKGLLRYVQFVVEINRPSSSVSCHQCA